MKRILILMCMAGSTHAFAEENRPGYITLSSSIGSAEYSDFGLSAKLGLDETWRLGVGASRSRSGASGNTGVFRAGAEAKVGDAWDLRLQLTGSRDPNEVSSFGFSPGFSWEFSSLWSGELATFLDVDFERNRYRQTLSGPRRTLTRAFVQQVFRLSLSQEFSESLSLSLGFERYRYNESGALINQAVSSRRLSYGSLNSYIIGFPESAGTISLDWSPAAGWMISPHAGRAKSVVDGLSTKNYGLAVEKALGEAWLVTLDYTNSRPEDASRTDLFSLDLTYNL